MNTHDDNDMLSGDDDLKALYRSLPRKEPSPALDSAIKRAAADAVRPRHSLPRWPIAVASTAVIVVAGALGWRMAQQPSASHHSVSQTVAASAAPQAPPVLAAPPATGNLDAAPSLAPAPASLAVARETPHENIRSAMKAKVVAPAAPARQAPVAAAESAPVVAMTEAAAPAPAPAAPAYALQAARSSVTSAEPRMAMKAMVMPAAAPQRDATAADTADTPDQELAKIRELFALQRHDEAVQRLAAFQKAHPDVPLPDDLRTQLPDHE
ncbi:hypothetical protein [Dyella sp. C11]|uniref:hypothetical protein n=1 Tax=Dyella sp. C11 TaxID=2126991 RepID=UPI000D65283A|nr:hypothetical protein [Dyella sp. C11]